MATTFQNDVLFEGDNTIIVHLQGYGDTDQAAVTVIDLNTLQFPGNPHSHLGVDGADRLSLMEITWGIQGWEYVQLLWSAGTNDEIITMSGDGSASFRGVGGKHDPQSTTPVGDILLTSQGADTDSSYNIVVVFKKKPA